MTDPYVVLGVARTASDDEIKAAYRALAKKYHPDNYANAPDIADVASEKMREVNEAYDTIVKERKNGGSAAGSAGSSYSSSTTTSGGSSYSNASSNAGSAGSYQTPNYGAGQQTGGNAYNNPYSTTTAFPDIRRLIMENRFDDANAVLDGVPTDRRNAEWNFLKGTVLYRRGWLEQSYVYLNTAVNMAPGNSEFRAAFNQVSRMRSGSAGGYKVGKKDKDGCNPFGMCCSLMCADQCCECCGGDLISCC